MTAGGRAGGTVDDAGSSLLAQRLRIPSGTRPRPSRHTGPWREADVNRWLLITVVGLTLTAVGWYLNSGNAYPFRQYGGVALVIGGLILAAGVGPASWFLAGRQAVGARQQQLLWVDRVEGVVAPAVSRPQGFTSTVLVAGDGLRHFHRSDCLMASGRSWATGPRSRFEASRMIPCSVCRP